MNSKKNNKLEKEPILENGLLDVLEEIYGFIKQTGRKYIQDFYPVIQYSDDPKPYGFHADINAPDKENYFGVSGGGCSFQSQELAATRCLVEALERYCLHNCDKKLFRSTTKTIKKLFIDPTQVVSFHPDQKIRVCEDEFRIGDNQDWHWVEGQDLQGQPVLLPAQLVFINFYGREKEPSILFPISTGSAGHQTVEQAVISGICEIVERDAFLIYYLNRIVPTKIDLRSEPRLDFLQHYFERYNLELYLFGTKTDVGIHSFMAIVRDRSGLGPAVSVGLKAGLLPVEAMLSAIDEAVLPRAWVRKEMGNPDLDRKSASELSDMRDRALFWSTESNAGHLDFMLKSRPTASVSDFPTFSAGNPSDDLKLISRDLGKRNIPTYFANIKPKALSGLDLSFVRVLMPTMQPLYLDERFPYLGGDRVYRIPKQIGKRKSPQTWKALNKVPHPFL